jgi:hypothetical protein
MNKILSFRSVEVAQWCLILLAFHYIPPKEPIQRSFCDPGMIYPQKRECGIMENNN